MPRDSKFTREDLGQQCNITTTKCLSRACPLLFSPIAPLMTVGDGKIPRGCVRKRPMEHVFILVTSLGDVKKVSCDFRAPSTSIGNLKHRGLVHRFHPWMPTVHSQLSCGIANNSAISSRFQKSSRENTQGVEILHTNIHIIAKRTNIHSIATNPSGTMEGGASTSSPHFRNSNSVRYCRYSALHRKLEIKSLFPVFFSSSISGKV